MANTRLELERIKKENKVLQDFLAGNKTDTADVEVKASKVQSIKASDPQVTMGNTPYSALRLNDSGEVRRKRLADGSFEVISGDPESLKRGKDGRDLKSSRNVDSAYDVALEANVRGKRGVSDAKRLKAEEARLPEDVRIKRQFEQIYRKQVAETRKTRLKELAQDFMDKAPEGGVSPYNTMDAELSNIMRSRLNLPEEEEQKPSLLESLRKGISSFFADDRKTSAGETLVDSISGEGKQDPRVQALAALEAANMPTTEANIQAVLAQLQEGG